MVPINLIGVFFIFLLATVSVHGIPYHLNLFDTAGKVSMHFKIALVSNASLKY